MSLEELTLISGDDLAVLHGYKSVTSQCRAWWRSIGIVPLPGRRNLYDPQLVRDCIDSAGGRFVALPKNKAAQPTLIDQRRARKNAKG